MKVKNEYVKINIGKNNFSFKNTILNKYLEKLAKNQVKDVGAGYAPILNACYLKFDDKLIFDEESELHIKHFNKKCSGFIINKEYNNNVVSTTYKYNTDSIKSYLNKNITAIGFFEDGIDECLACINTYGLGLTITDFSNFYIERKDSIEIEAEFSNYNPGVSTSTINMPLHLMPGEHTLNGQNIKIFLDNIYLGDKVVTYIMRNPHIEEDSLKNGIIEITDVFNSSYKNGLIVPNYTIPNSNTSPISIGQQYSYLWLQYTPYTDTQRINEPYYLKIPLKIIGDYNISIKFERSDD